MAFEKKIDRLFPNIFKTAYSDFDQLVEKSNEQYTNEYQDDYILDFDYLMKNKPSKDIISIGSLDYSFTLPTLLYTFATTEEAELQNNLLELILRCFSQRSNLLRNLKQVNLFFSDDDIQIFTYFSKIVVELRILVQNSDTFIGANPYAKYSTKPVQDFRFTINNLIVGVLKDSRVGQQNQILFDEAQIFCLIQLQTTRAEH